MEILVNGILNREFLCLFLLDRTRAFGVITEYIFTFLFCWDFRARVQENNCGIKLLSNIK